MSAAPGAGPIGMPTGGKAVNLSQLQNELTAAGMDVSRGLGMTAGYVFTYDAAGDPADFAPTDRGTVAQAIYVHQAKRKKTDQEYSAEFQDPTTTPERRQQIRDQVADLIPRDDVPMEPV
jgi:hypothetical protein